MTGRADAGAMGRGPALASMGLAVAAVAIAAGCAAQFTAMPALFLGHIAAMCACWCLMTAGSVVYSMAGFWPATGKNKDTARKAHAAIQSTAVLAALVSFLRRAKIPVLAVNPFLGHDAKAG
ncbi:unnamed protein product [Effrenium voratum]|uniref:Uncharacterized protein n=1 Tax=Effrenium voratum TaxID=2562239 RepID=A0AA36HJB1_9DINO|nr:unnamed protein product [Effrenium voratum]